MTDSVQPLIRTISDTARWVATYRARETERDDALFRDPYARRLAGEQGEQIAQAHGFTEKHSWPMVMRTYLFDEFVTGEVRAGADLVVNLAAGLDARPYRLKPPTELRWVEIDFAEVIAYKEHVLAGESPTCRLERIGLDLLDVDARHDVLRAVRGTATRAIVLANEMGDLVSRAGAPYRFAPEDGPEFFRRCGWRPTDVRSTFRTAAQLNRLPADSQAYAQYPDPPEPWRLPIPWSAAVRLARE